MPLGFALVPKFRTELRPSPKPRRGCLFIDRDSKPICFLFVFRRRNGHSKVANQTRHPTFVQFSSSRLAPPKNKKKGRENCRSINRQPLRGLEPLQLAEKQFITEI